MRCYLIYILIGLLMSISNPTQIPGLVGWWTAKRGIIRTGDVIDSWTSQEGSSFVMDSPSGAAKPTMVADVGVFDREVVTYDGVDDVIENLPADTPSISIAADTPLFIFLVMKYPTAESSSGSRIYNFQTSLANRIEITTIIGTALGALRATISPGAAADAIEGTDFDQGDWLIVSVISPTGTTGAAFDIRLSNVIISAGSVGAGNLGVNECLLGHPSATSFANTRYAEVVIYGGAGVSLSARNLGDLQAYFLRGWFVDLVEKGGSGYMTASYFGQVEPPSGW